MVRRIFWHWPKSGMAAQGVADIEPPTSLGLQLRPYQEGVSWLQFLRRNGSPGLADDMGLGKTAQALAHLLIRKRGGSTAGVRR